MKKVWRCSNCKQMSTRLGNLKRHIGRKHNGTGKPIMQYIVGNSIITPEEARTTLQVFRDEYTANQHPKRSPSSFHTITSHVQNDDDWLGGWTDRYIEPILKLNEYQVRMNAVNQSLNPYPPSHFSQFVQPQYAVGNSPAYIPVERDSEERDIKSRNYDGVSGFKSEICAFCLEILSMPIGPIDYRIQDIHRCDLMSVEAIIKQKSRVYVNELHRKLQSLPELLLQHCKDWANNTTGQLYLTVTSTRLLNDGDNKNHETQENYDSLPFIKKVLSESKIKITDAELLEFLGLAKNQTRTTLAIRSNNGGTYLEYNLALTNA